MKKPIRVLHTAVGQSTRGLRVWPFADRRAQVRRFLQRLLLPGERVLLVSVIVFREVVDVLGEAVNRQGVVVSQGPSAEDREPDFDLIEPGCVNWKVHWNETGMLSLKGHSLLACVGGAVVENGLSGKCDGDSVFVPLE